MAVRWRRVVGALAVVGVLGCAGLVGAGYSMFGRDSAIAEGEMADGVHVVVDGFVSSFVVEVNGGVVLIDAGEDPEATGIKEKLAELDNPPVLALLLTHGHPDHVGGCGAFPGVPVLAHAAEADLVEGRAAAEGPVTRWSRNDGSCTVSHRVQHGAAVRFGHMSFEAYHLPGHTAGSVAWLGRRVLFLGDAASATATGEVGAAKWIFTDDPAQAAASLAGLSAQLPDRGVEWLAFAHSGPLRGVKPLQRLSPR